MLVYSRIDFLLTSINIEGTLVRILSPVLSQNFFSFEKPENYCVEKQNEIHMYTLSLYEFHSRSRRDCLVFSLRVLTMVLLPVEFVPVSNMANLLLYIKLYEHI